MLSTCLRIFPTSTLLCCRWWWTRHQLNPPERILCPPHHNHNQDHSSMDCRSRRNAQRIHSCPIHNLGLTLTLVHHYSQTEFHILFHSLARPCGCWCWWGRWRCAPPLDPWLHSGICSAATWCLYPCDRMGSSQQLVLATNSSFCIQIV